MANQLPAPASHRQLRASAGTAASIGDQKRHHQPKPQPIRTAYYSFAGHGGEANTQRPATNQQAPENFWANLTGVPDGYYATYRTRRHTRDIRVLREVWLPWRVTALPREGRWASPLFEDCWLGTERDFIKVWHMALQRHDTGIRHMWKQYCDTRGEGTQDPYRVTIEFSRIFLFLYGGQDADFFTQHITARLLPKWKEDELLFEAAEAFEATHVRYEPPLANWPPVQVFLGTSAAAGVQRNPAGEHRHGPGQPYARQHQHPVVHEVAPYTAQHHGQLQNQATPHHGWQTTQQWGQAQSAAWDWAPQPGWVATTNWHWQS